MRISFVSVVVLVVLAAGLTAATLQDQLNSAIAAAQTSLVWNACTSCTGAGNWNITIDASSSSIKTIYAYGVTIDCTNATNILFGVKIINRNRDLSIYGLGFTKCKGALLIQDASPMLISASFSQDTQTAVTISSFSAPVFVNCTWTLNAAAAASNSGSGGAVYLDGAPLSSGMKTEFRDCSFAGNRAVASGYGGALMLRSPAFISNSYFSGCTSPTSCFTGAAQGGAIFARSTLTIVGSQFYKNAAGLVGSGVFASPGPLDTVYIYNTSFAANGAYNSVGGGLYVASEGLITLDSVTFMNNTLSATGGAIQGTNGRLRVLKSRFINNQNIAVRLTSSDATFFEDCYFQSNQCMDQGCAISYESSDAASAVDSLTISRTSFANHRTLKLQYSTGGSIYHSGMNLNVTMCTFSGSYAYYGGAVYSNAVTKGNSVPSVIMAGNTFTNEQAAAGSALYLNAIPRLFTLQKVMDGNSFISSPPFISSAPAQTNPVQAAAFPPTVYAGELINVSLTVVDAFGAQIPTSSDFPSVSISVDSGQSCYLASGGVVSLVNGQATTSGMSIGGPLNSTCVVLFGVGARKQSRFVTFINPTCQPGYYYFNGVCVACARGTYNLDGISGCFDCPDGATCPGANLVLSRKNFYRNIEGNKAKMYSCDLENCAFSSPCASMCLADNRCANHYQNVLCATCGSGYAKVNGICIPCKSHGVGGGAVTFMVIMGLALLFLIYTLHNKSFSFMKIFFDFFQTCAILANFSYMNVFSLNFAIFGSAITDECVSDMSYAQYFALSVFSPFVWLLGMALTFPVYAGYVFWQSTRHRGDPAFEGFNPKNVVVASFLQSLLFLLTFLHTPVSEVVLDHFAYRVIGGEKYLSSNPAVSFGSESHKDVTGLAIAFLIIVVILLPLAFAAAFLLIKDRLPRRPQAESPHGAFSSSDKYAVSSSTTSADSSEGLVRAFKFFILTYNRQWYFYDLVYLFRRLLLLIVTRQWHDYSISARLFLAVAVVVVHMFVHFYTKPFVQRAVNKVASLSCLALVIVAIIYEQIPVLDRLQDTDTTQSTLGFRVLIALIFCFWVAAFIGWLGWKIKKYWKDPPGSQREKAAITSRNEADAGLIENQR
eukprot:ANDGO_02249.mRNA.1 Putative leucine-rich repeat-containing protein DDB_G0281931